MKQLDILNKIEELLQNSLKSKSSNSDNYTETTIEMEEETTTEKNTVSSLFKEIFNLLISFLMSIIKIPFQLIQSYIKNEIVAVVRKEVKLYFVLMALLGVLFTVFIVSWVLISLAMGMYFQELGISNVTSILYVLGFQIVIFLIVVFFFFRVSKKIKSISLMNKILKEN
jgi:hypothetical protein